LSVQLVAFYHIVNSMARWANGGIYNAVASDGAEWSGRIVPHKRVSSRLTVDCTIEESQQF
jgi:hypothetical protein